MIANNSRLWLHGLAAAFIGSSASSLGAILVAPDRFNLTTGAGLRNTLLSSLLSGGASAAAYLRQSPLPPVNIEEKTQTITDGNITATATSVKTTTQQEVK